MICSDNDIICGTHAIVDHKKLEPNEIEFHLVCSKVINRTPHTTLFTQDRVSERVTDKVSDKVSEKGLEILRLLEEDPGYTSDQLAEKMEVDTKSRKTGF